MEMPKKKISFLCKKKKVRTLLKKLKHSNKIFFLNSLTEGDIVKSQKMKKKKKSVK